MTSAASLTADATALTGAARMLAVVRVLAEHPSGSRLGEVAAALGTPKSSAHRSLAVLVRGGFARQDADGLYHLGFDLLRLVFSYQEAQPTVHAVAPVLQRLAEATGETTHYGTLIDGAIVYQAKVSPPRATFQMSSVIGGSNPAYRTGIGKALLMHALPDRAAVDRYVETYGPLEARTPHTLVTAEALHEALRGYRRSGYALDLQENDLGVICIAFPLFLDSPSRPTGALSISAVASRTSPEELVARVPAIRAVVAEELGPGVLPAPVSPTPLPTSLPATPETRP
jgi:IclR family acetate operon transcriptional repressor